MTAKELLQSQMNDVGGQLQRAVEGVTSEQASIKMHPEAMSVTEQLAHLSEVYQAVLTILAGGKHEWGSYVPPSTEIGALNESCFSLRKQAVEAVLAKEENLQTGSDFIVGHDNYHVGQLVTTRLGFDPAWNSYAIYGE
ncbi:MAG TPA: hypothetical protein VG944_20105 [Fimbriimonas sp.]|nr:hypothetical protein [Fimbriimonas sp.]